jgi:hypothetical protein
VCNPEGVKLLEAEPVVAPEVAPEPTRETPQEQPPSPPEAARTCSACGAPMEPDQDWCLNCGTAAAGTLGKRPGWRAASTIIGLTLVLVLGAIGASYAALRTDSKPTAATPAPAPAQSQAQVTPATPAQTTPATPAPQQTTPATPAKPAKIPKVKTPTTGSTTGSPITPAPAATTPVPTTSTPTTSTPAQPPSGTTTGQQGTQQTTPGPQAIQVAGDAGKAYDPYHRIKASGDTERALDGDAATSWYVDPLNPEQIGVGYAVDLGKLQGIREIELQTPTPGFRIEVYATDETELPPDILDTRWSHITNVSDVGAKEDGKEKVVLGAGTTKYRNLLLWFTQPPTGGPRLRLTELSLLG